MFLELLIKCCTSTLFVQKEVFLNVYLLFLTRRYWIVFNGSEVHTQESKWAFFEEYMYIWRYLHNNSALRNNPLSERICTKIARFYNCLLTALTMIRHPVFPDMRRPVLTEFSFTCAPQCWEVFHSSHSPSVAKQAERTNVYFIILQKLTALMNALLEHGVTGTVSYY